MDLVLLKDTTRVICYKDAAFIEYARIVMDSTLKYQQVRLSEENIESYYNDLLDICNESNMLSNSLFKNMFRLHTYCTDILY